MAVTIRHTSLPTKSVREMAVALHHVGLTGKLEVGVEGPEMWVAETPPLTPNQFAKVAAEIIKMTYEGQQYTLAGWIESAKKVITDQTDDIKKLQGNYERAVEDKEVFQKQLSDNVNARHKLEDQVSDLNIKVAQLEENVKMAAQAAEARGGMA